VERPKPSGMQTMHRLRNQWRRRPQGSPKPRAGPDFDASNANSAGPLTSTGVDPKKKSIYELDEHGHFILSREQTSSSVRTIGSSLDVDESIGSSIVANYGSAADSSERNDLLSFMGDVYVHGENGDDVLLLSNMGGAFGKTVSPPRVTFADEAASLPERARMDVIESCEPDRITIDPQDYTNTVLELNQRFSQLSEAREKQYPDRGLFLPNQQSIIQDPLASESIPSLTTGPSLRDTESSVGYDGALKDSLAVAQADDPGISSGRLFTYQKPVYQPYHLSPSTIGDQPLLYDGQPYIEHLNTILPGETPPTSIGTREFVHPSPIQEVREDEIMGDYDSDDSESFWMSDFSGSPPALEEQHSLLFGFKVTILEQLLSTFNARFQNGYQSSGDDSSNPSSAANSNQRSATEQASGERPQKRRMFSGGNDEENRDDPGLAQKKLKMPHSGKRRRFLLACPFAKKDPLRYRACYRQNLSKISYVKQHLSRHHRLPIYCPVCMETFNSEEARDIHTRARSCEERPMGEWEGVTETQKKQLQKRVPPKMSEENQWYTIFEVLFPGQVRPQSPYVDSKLSEELSALEDFVTGHGPTLIIERLRAEGFTVDNQPQESERSALLQAVLADGLQAIFGHWINARQPIRPESFINTEENNAGGRYSVDTPVEDPDINRNPIDTLPVLTIDEDDNNEDGDHESTTDLFGTSSIQPDPLVAEDFSFLNDLESDLWDDENLRSMLSDFNGHDTRSIAPDPSAP